MSETKTGKPLSSSLKMFYGVGDCAFSTMTAVETYFFNRFLTDIAFVDNLGLATTVATIASTVDACLSWMYGAILNSIPAKKWGRYRSWLILITWLVPILYTFQFLKIGNGVVTAIVITLGAILSHVAWNFPYVANVSMIAVAGKTPEDRSQLAATRAAWGNASNVIFAFIQVALPTFVGSKIGEANKYAGTAFILGWIMVIMYFCHFKMFEGYEDAETETSVKKDVARTSGVDLIRALFQNPHLCVLLLADLAKWMFNFVCLGAATYYFSYVANQPDFQVKIIVVFNLLGLYMLIGNIACIIGSYLSKTLSNKLSTRTTAIFVMIFMAVFCLLAYLNYGNWKLVMVLMCIGRFGYGIAYACMPALYADTIVYSEWKSGKNASGWISGLQNVPLKVSIMTRAIIINACLAAGGYVAGISAAEASDNLKKMISLAFMGIPAIALIIASVLLLIGFRLTKDKVLKYQAEIAARKA